MVALSEGFHLASVVNIQIPELNSPQKQAIRKFVGDKEGSLLNWLQVNDQISNKQPDHILVPMIV